MKMTIRYKILVLLFVCASLTSCIDDDIAECIEVDDIPAMFTDGYSLNMIVTLDEMGGARAVEYTSDRGKELKALESYIDPEKFRVLFFDREERFLFESKSRWVKKIVPNEENGYSEWFVAVPIYAYGNDESEDWNWEEIRRVLTGEDMDEAIELYKQGKYQELYCEKSVQDAIEAKNNNQQIPAFKIAVLANRPNKEWNMGINGRYDAEFTVGGKSYGSGADIGKYGADGNLIEATAEITPGGWSIENGPKWSRNHTRWGDDGKTVFDLHHCQYDPIYDGKSYNDRGGQQTITKTPPNPDNEGYKFDVTGEYYNPGVVSTNTSQPNGYIHYKNYKVYDFIADEVKIGEGYDEYQNRPKMGATSTWVDWSGEDGKYNVYENKSEDPYLADLKYRYFVPPTKDHPIPMYGIQDFSKLEGWVKGTPFNLSKTTDGQEDDYDYRSISLLRSVVKLELVLEDRPAWVIMFYPNVYARCEPMDVWTPTNDIWSKNEDDYQHENNHEWSLGDCEWYNIIKYGAVTRTGESTNDNDAGYKDSRSTYQQRMSWFYGVWSDPGPDGSNARWHKDLKSLINQTTPQKGVDNPPYPQIFNSCVQRVTGAVCYDSKNKYELAFWEPADQRWHFVVYAGERNINDPSNIMRMGQTGNGSPTICYWQVGTGTNTNNRNNIYSIALAYADASGQSYRAAYIADGKPNRNMNTYEQPVQNGSATTMPWPLLRNHVYKITATGIRGAGQTAAMRSGGDGGFSVKSEILYSKSINFNRARSEKKAIEKKITEEKAIEKK